ncbi:hypothetical protein ACFXJ6_02780 [Streptomyces sp. NPDC059218]|uniref:hypothetical protein n=1 Tax=unclassified Streptomyces TaxID=2593676 RepID=UPI0036BBF085
MNTDYWTVLADSEREQWGYMPAETVGPLTFGIDRQGAITAMAGRGFIAEESEIERWNSLRAQWRVDFCRDASDKQWPAVKCYFVEGVGLTCVLVDGLRGPQIICEGIRLIGRVPSELSTEMEAHALERDEGIQFSLTGDLCWPGFDFERGAQRAGDAVVSWALFFNTGGIASTSWDIAPGEVWRHS